MTFLNTLLKVIGNLRNILTLIILTRLLFLENSQIASFLEVLSALGILLTTPLEDIE